MEQSWKNPYFFKGQVAEGLQCLYSTFFPPIAYNFSLEALFLSTPHLVKIIIYKNGFIFFCDYLLQFVVCLLVGSLYILASIQDIFIY